MKPITPSPLVDVKPGWTHLQEINTLLSSFNSNTIQVCCCLHHKVMNQRKMPKSIKFSLPFLIIVFPTENNPLLLCYIVYLLNLLPSFPLLPLSIITSRICSMNSTDPGFSTCSFFIVNLYPLSNLHFLFMWHFYARQVIPQRKMIDLKI